MTWWVLACVIGALVAALVVTIRRAAKVAARMEMADEVRRKRAAMQAVDPSTPADVADRLSRGDF